MKGEEIGENQEVDSSKPAVLILGEKSSYLIAKVLSVCVCVCFFVHRSRRRKSYMHRHRHTLGHSFPTLEKGVGKKAVKTFVCNMNIGVAFRLPGV